MRRLAITLAVTMTLCLVAAAGAALPLNGPFAGKTSVRPINGFYDLITFNAASGGKVLKKFTFGTLGCFGFGQFPAGVDAYGDPTATATVKSSIPVTTKGTFTLTTKPVLPDAGTTVTTVTIQGTFTSSKTVTGTIAVSQSDNGDTCGPSKMKFSAVPGTPNSLGLNA